MTKRKFWKSELLGDIQEQLAFYNFVINELRGEELSSFKLQMYESDVSHYRNLFRIVSLSLSLIIGTECHFEEREQNLGFYTDSDECIFQIVRRSDYD